MATHSLHSLSLLRPYRSPLLSPPPKPFPTLVSPVRSLRRRRSPPAIHPAPAASAAAGSAASSSGFDSAAVDDLGDVAIFPASTGEPVFIRDLWDQNEVESPFFLQFLSLDLPIYVGNGRSGTFKAFWMSLLLPFPSDCLYADPDRKAYDVLGLYYGLARTFFNPASAKVFSRFESLKNAVKNYTIEATPDDRASVLQQGGMFVFKGKELLYARKDEGTGDHAPLDEILDICCKVPVAGKID
ncbi:thioredoxin-like protein AAED1, chloroplastic isoform X3 [Ananas comosus]|uniref:Thioredoxin-like protein AAED1, chloroplastic isoform X3 n=1 Tax=Ananas comosus TaxID=4615 RepID=A0A6P5F7I4_ANACO|nr:thioredoxin-like protein AAED1, chloroplastic isoform X3 [Ananas comosus]